jgi:hypothetical protein
MGKTTIFFLPPSRYRTQETEGPADGGGSGAGDPGHGGGREVGQNEEEVEGNSFRSLPRAGVLRRGGSMAAGGLQPGTARAALVVAMESSGRRGDWSWRCRRGGEPVRPFYRRGKVGLVRII